MSTVYGAQIQQSRDTKKAPVAPFKTRWKNDYFARCAKALFAWAML